MKSVYFCFVIACLAFTAGFASGQEPLTNGDITQLHEAGLPPAVIIAKIRASEHEFDTSVEALVALAEAGIPDEVIAEMTNPQMSPEENGSGSSQAVHSGTLTVGHKATVQPNAPGQFNDPRCPNPGVFVETEDGGVSELDASAYSGAKTSGRLKSALTYGIVSVKSKAMIQGLQSHNKIPNRKPVFYFCFEETETGLSYETSGATTPSQFLLVKLNPKEKENARLLVTGKINAYTGGYAGPPAKFRVDFTFEKIAPGIYQVTPSTLEPGEYCFFYTGSASATVVTTYGLFNSNGGGKVFDFSIF